MWFIFLFFALNCIFFNAESKPFELGLQSFFTWSHGVHIGVSRLWNGDHVGVPNKSFGSWTLFLWKRISYFFVHINLHKRWPPEWPEWKRSINISPCVPVFVYHVYLLTSSIFNGVLNYLVRRCYLCDSFQPHVTTLTTAPVPSTAFVGGQMNVAAMTDTLVMTVWIAL